ALALANKSGAAADQRNLAWVDDARLLAAFAVVFLHANAACVNQLPAGSTGWQIGVCYSSLFRWCVPVFVMLAGVLLTAKHDTLTDFYQKRLMRLAAPLIVWSLVYLLWTVLKLEFKGQPPQFL